MPPAGRLPPGRLARHIPRRRRPAGRGRARRGQLLLVLPARQPRAHPGSAGTEAHAGCAAPPPAAMGARPAAAPRPPAPRGEGRAVRGGYLPPLRSLRAALEPLHVLRAWRVTLPAAAPPRYECDCFPPLRVCVTGHKRPGGARRGDPRSRRARPGSRPAAGRTSRPPPPAPRTSLGRRQPRSPAEDLPPTSRNRAACPSAPAPRLRAAE